MPKPMVVLNVQQCEPNQCENGICPAALQCRRKALVQEQPFEVPELNSERCLGCAVCVTICGRKSLQVYRW